MFECLHTSACMHFTYEYILCIFAARKTVLMQDISCQMVYMLSFIAFS